MNLENLIFSLVKAGYYATFKPGPNGCLYIIEVSKFEMDSNQVKRVQLQINPLEPEVNWNWVYREIFEFADRELNK